MSVQNSFDSFAHYSMLLKGLEVVCCMSEVHLCVPKKIQISVLFFCARKSDKLAMSSAHSHFHSHHLHFHIGMDYSCVTVVRPNVTHQSMTTKIFAFVLGRVQGGFLLIWQGWRWHHHHQRAWHRHEVVGPEPHRGWTAGHDQWGGCWRWVCTMYLV